MIFTLRTPRPAVVLPVVGLMIGFTILISGWILSNDGAPRLLPWQVQMKAHTALAVVGLAAGLLLRERSARSRLATGLSLGVLALALSTIGEYLTGLDLGVYAVIPDMSGPYLDRMSPLSAVAVAGTAAALLIGRRSPWVSTTLALLALGVSGVTVLGILFAAKAPVFLASYPVMATTAAIAIGCLALAALGRAALPSLAVVTARGPGGLMARRMIVAAFAVPVTFGWLRLVGQDAGLFDTRYGTTVFTAAMIAVMVAVVLATTSMAERIDRARAEAATAARTAEHAGAVALNADVAIIGYDLDGIVDTWNLAAERMYGFTRAEMLGQTIAPITPIGREGEVEAILNDARNGLGTGPMDTVRMHHDGRVVPVLLTVSPVTNAAGEVIGVAHVSIDITERRALEDEARRLEKMLADSQAVTGVGSWEGNTVTGERRWSAGMYRILGGEPNAGPLDSAAVSAMIHEDDRPGLLAAVQGAIGSRGTWSIDCRLTRMDGVEIWIESAGGVVSGDDDASSVAGTIRDISDRKRAEIERGRSERRLAQILASAPDGVAGVGADGTISFANAEMGRLFGYDPVDLVGLDVDRLVGGDQRGGHSRRRESYTHAASVRPMGSGLLVMGRRRDGTEFPADVALGPSRDPEDAITVVTVRDATARRVAEAEREALGLELERSNRELQSFAAIASHDLQEPLRKIEAFGDKLDELYAAELGRQGSDYLARMRNAAVRMQVLIHDLLTYSRVTSAPTEIRATDLGHIVRDVLVDLETAIEASGAHVTTAPMPTVAADPLQMRQLFQNLIGNALKYRRPGTAPLVSVTATPILADRSPMRSSAAVLFWRIEVRDNGIGFEPRYAEQIFAPFERLHGRTQYEGTGMGLAICRRIVEFAGGSISASGDPGEGSVFTVILRASAVDLPVAA